MSKSPFRPVPIKTYYADLDKRVRRCIRLCYWKQWRGSQQRIANLRKLVVTEDEAVTHGCSRKGPWTMSSSRAVHEALSLDYLAHEGLASLLTIWQSLTAKDLNARHGPACRVVRKGLSREAAPYTDPCSATGHRTSTSRLRCAIL